MNKIRTKTDNRMEHEYQNAEENKTIELGAATALEDIDCCIGAVLHDVAAVACIETCERQKAQEKRKKDVYAYDE